MESTNFCIEDGFSDFEYTLSKFRGTGVKEKKGGGIEENDRGLSLSMHQF